MNGGGVVPVLALAGGCVEALVLGFVCGVWLVAGVTTGGGDVLSGGVAGSVADVFTVDGVPVDGVVGVGAVTVGSGSTTGSFGCVPRVYATTAPAPSKSARIANAITKP